MLKFFAFLPFSLVLKIDLDVIFQSDIVDTIMNLGIHIFFCAY